MMEKAKEVQGMPDNIKWSSVCNKCKSDNDGVCPNKVCFELHYDEEGNWLPEWIS